MARPAGRVKGPKFKVQSWKRFAAGTIVLSGMGNFATRIQIAARRCHRRTSGNVGGAFSTGPPARKTTRAAAVDASRSAIITTNVAALLQPTFTAADLKARTRTLNRGDKIEPLDLVEWLEEQGYEPEAQITQRGDIALRGGILDVYPMTCPWPVRLEFFGDELESLRHFDPITQVSRDQITSVILPPGGELGILKRARDAGRPSFATLLDYLPCETIFLLCEPANISARADEYAGQVPENDPFFVPWEEFRKQMFAKGISSVEVFEADELLGDPASPDFALPTPHSELIFSSLDTFRPLGSRAPEPQIAEAQRREFFAQLHRWSRQGFVVHVFCNNDGERQRFGEIWKDCGFEGSAPLSIHLGALSRGFIWHEESKFVVVTDAGNIRTLQGPASAPA